MANRVPLVIAGDRIREIADSDTLDLTGNSLIIGGNITPAVDSAYDLGDSNHKFKSLYLSGQTIYLGSLTLSDTTSGVKIEKNGTQITKLDGGLDSNLVNNIAVGAVSSGLPDAGIYPHSNRIGIGNPLPTAKLDVTGAIKASDSASLGGNLNLTNGKFISWSSNAYVMASSTSVSFGIGGSTHFTMDSAGKIGIGTETPTNQLTVSGTLGSGAHTISGTGSTTLKDSGGGFVLDITDSAPFSVKINGTEKIAIKPTGQVLAETVKATGSFIFPDGSTQAAAAQGVPVGTVQYFAMNTPPTGWLKANGSAISRSTYADLFTAIGTTFGVGDGSTTFTLPDLRGEFVRGWDDSRGVDTSRAFGSWQVGTGVSYDGRSQQHVQNYEEAYSSSSDTNGPASYQYGEGRTFVRIRPRNVAMLACIKY